MLIGRRSPGPRVTFVITRTSKGWLVETAASRTRVGTSVVLSTVRMLQPGLATDCCTTSLTREGPVLSGRQGPATSVSENTCVVLSDQYGMLRKLVPSCSPGQQAGEQ